MVYPSLVWIIDNVDVVVKTNVSCWYLFDILGGGVVANEGIGRHISLIGVLSGGWPPDNGMSSMFVGG